MERHADLAKLADADLFLARHPARFLLLGSASPALLRQASESLAGRIAFHHLGPFDVREIQPEGAAMTRLWLRGGYP